MTKEQMIETLRYKANNIKAHIEPKFFNEVADTLEKQIGKDINVTSKYNEWISVKDKLPEDDVAKDRKAIDVLVTTKGGRVSKVQRIKNTFNKTNPYWYWGRISGEVIAWQLLPKPYKAGE